MRAHYRRYERSNFSINSSNESSTMTSNTGTQLLNQDNQVPLVKDNAMHNRLLFRAGSKPSIINIKSRSSKAIRPSSLEKDLSSKRQTRADSLGIPINHFNKRIYRVSFVDQLSSKPFAEVLEEKDTLNGKEERNEEKKKDNDKDGTLCKCILF